MRRRRTTLTTVAVAFAMALVAWAGGVPGTAPLGKFWPATTATAAQDGTAAVEGFRSPVLA